MVPSLPKMVDICNITLITCCNNAGCLKQTICWKIYPVSDGYTLINYKKCILPSKVIILRYLSNKRQMKRLPNNEQLVKSKLSIFFTTKNIRSLG